MQHGAPKEIFPYVREFCRTLNPENGPFFLKVTPEEAAKPLACTLNVEDKIQKEGGSAVYGWKIWEWYGLMIEAEFHTVWRSADGDLYDITPNEGGYEKVLFLPDESIRYEGKQINNVRRSLSGNSKVQSYIEAHEHLFEIYNRGDRAFQYKIELSDAETMELKKVQLAIAKLAIEILKSTPGRNELCGCGSGKKYKKCCDT